MAGSRSRVAVNDWIHVAVWLVSYILGDFFITELLYATALFINRVPDYVVAFTLNIWLYVLIALVVYLPTWA